MTLSTTLHHSRWFSWFSTMVLVVILVSEITDDIQRGYHWAFVVLFALTNVVVFYHIVMAVWVAHYIAKSGVAVKVQHKTTVIVRQGS